MDLERSLKNRVFLLFPFMNWGWLKGKSEYSCGEVVEQGFPQNFFGSCELDNIDHNMGGLQIRQQTQSTS